MMVEEYRKGKSLKEVGNLFGRTSSFVTTHLNKIGCQRRPKGGPNHLGNYSIDSSVRRRIFQLREKSFSFTDIARKVNLPVWKVKYVLCKSFAMEKKIIRGGIDMILEWTEKPKSSGWHFWRKKKTIKNESKWIPIYVIISRRGKQVDYYFSSQQSAMPQKGWWAKI